MLLTKRVSTLRQRIEFQTDCQWEMAPLAIFCSVSASRILVSTSCIHLSSILQPIVASRFPSLPASHPVPASCLPFTASCILESSWFLSSSNSTVGRAVLDQPVSHVYVFRPPCIVYLCHWFMVCFSSCAILFHRSGPMGHPVMGKGRAAGRSAHVIHRPICCRSLKEQSQRPAGHTSGT